MLRQFSEEFSGLVRTIKIYNRIAVVGQDVYERSLIGVDIQSSLPQVLQEEVPFTDVPEGIPIGSAPNSRYRILHTNIRDLFDIYSG